MGIAVTVTFDLHGAASSKYEELYTELRKSGWAKKNDKASSVIECTFKDGATYQGILDTTRKDFADAAKAASVHYSGEIVVGFPPASLS